MKKVLVFGGGGQLAQCLNKTGSQQLNLVYFTSKDVNILEESHLKEVFKAHAPDVVINCAAYTAVDLAEDEPLKAAAVNAQAPEAIAQLCAAYDSLLIHVSTDFVFDGDVAHPLGETEIPNPINTYGKTKLLGEEAIIRSWDKHIIIRTSWLYSEFGNNFLKTMVRLGKERDELGVIYDQIGSPTYAIDLAELIIKLAESELPAYGLYHYSNEGTASWYDFAHAIFKSTGLNVRLRPMRTSEYPTKATRPAYSVMDKAKIKETFNITIPHWRDSLDRCINNLPV